MEKDQTFSKTTFLQSGFFNFGPFWLILAKIEKAILEKSCFTKSLIFFHCISHPKKKITRFSKVKNFGSFMANILANSIPGASGAYFNSNDRYICKINAKITKTADDKVKFLSFMYYK